MIKLPLRAAAALLPICLLLSTPACDLLRGERGTRVDTATAVLPVPHDGSDVAASTPGYHFADAQGNVPLSLVVQPGSRVAAVFLDSAAAKLPRTEARQRARAVAVALWAQIGKAEEADTVSVAFTNRAKITSDKVSREFFFYPTDLDTVK
ncbi:MAG TPA: hypothetical protein VFE05_01615 [Longimicrobiaceae bacterium]|jgi:hypothetical protein|nr:hypothetical protein [Longimicrobiaceae bacterium]